MESGTRPFGCTLPRLKQFRMGVHFIAATKDFHFDIRVEEQYKLFRFFYLRDFFRFRPVNCC